MLPSANGVEFEAGIEGGETWRWRERSLVVEGVNPFPCAVPPSVAAGSAVADRRWGLVFGESYSQADEGAITGGGGDGAMR